MPESTYAPLWKRMGGDEATPFTAGISEPKWFFRSVCKKAYKSKADSEREKIFEDIIQNMRLVKSDYKQFRKRIGECADHGIVAKTILPMLFMEDQVRYDKRNVFPLSPPAYFPAQESVSGVKKDYKKIKKWCKKAIKLTRKVERRNKEAEKNTKELLTARDNVALRHRLASTHDSIAKLEGEVDAYAEELHKTYVVMIPKKREEYKNYLDEVKRKSVAGAVSPQLIRFVERRHNMFLNVLNNLTALHYCVDGIQDKYDKNTVIRESQK